MPLGKSLGTLINYRGDSAKFGDFHGRLLILDFWASWCAPCIKSFETVSELEHEFGDKIFILGVSERINDHAEKIPDFLRKINRNITSVVGDTLLGKMFPHLIVPHCVWISPSGVIVAITGTEELTSQNIRKALTGQGVSLKTKKERNFSFESPLFYNGNGGYPTKSVYQSVLTDSVDGLPGFSFSFRDSLGAMSAYSACTTDIGILQNIFTIGRYPVHPNPKTFFLKKGNSLVPIPAKVPKGDWIVLDSIVMNKFYAYSIWLPDGAKVSDTVFFRDYVLNDLNRLFKYRVTFEKKVIPCIVIRKKINWNSKLFSTKDGFPKFYYSNLQQAGTHGMHDILDHVDNIKFGEIVNFFRSYPLTDPIVDETGLSDRPLDMEVHLKYELDDARNKPLDLKIVATALNKIGLEIVLEPREHEVMVLSKK